MSLIVGIDLGTTNSLIGSMDAGFPVLIADAAGERLTPSVVHFPEHGEPVVGRAAERMRGIEPEATVASVKRWMGRRAGEESGGADARLAGGSGPPLRLRLRGRDYLPEEISALILRKLKADAERSLALPVERAVITVPAYFNEAQRQATKRAGELAGLAVERIVNEPTAAALAYGLGLERKGGRQRIAVFDLGGGTFDISILELNGGVFHVLATHGNTRLGGDDIDAALLAACDLALPAWQKRALVVEAKHRLSLEEAVALPLPFATEGGSVVYRLSRAALERLASPIVEKTRAHCLRALADARIEPGDLDEIILVGGATRMPLVRRIVAEIFGREPDASQNPDEAVALGATIQAGILSGAVQQVVLLDVTPLSLGIETFGGLMNVIIPRNSTIPTKAGEMFTNAVGGQRSMRIKVLQGERELARDNWTLGEFDLDFEPAPEHQARVGVPEHQARVGVPKGQARVGVQFEIDADGLLHVLARDTKSGLEKRIEVRSVVDVHSQAVEQMIEASVEHAFEDMSARQFAEAKIKAEDLLAAVDAGLSKLAGTLSDADRAEIDSLAAAVKAAIEQQSAPALKKANEALDQGTEHLAALLIEQAMR
jgi:molecular chaperone DnaK